MKIESISNLQLYFCRKIENWIYLQFKISKSCYQNGNWIHLKFWIFKFRYQYQIMNIESTYTFQYSFCHKFENGINLQLWIFKHLDH